MADLATLHYSFVKPEVGASKNTWGTKVNANSDSLDTVIYTLRTDFTTSGTNLQNSINANAASITALQNVDTSHTNSINQLNAQFTAAQNGYYNHMPIGVIIMWAWGVGAGQYPTGFAICDGRTVNRTDGLGQIQTPNLVNYFIRASASAGGSGGAWDIWSDARGAHTHGGGVDAHTLTLAEIPSHAHQISSTNQMGGGGGQQPTNYNGGNTWITQAVGGGAAHGHGLTINGVGDHQHIVHTEPPWIGLVYLMRV